MLPELPEEKALSRRGDRPARRGPAARRPAAWLVARDVTGGSVGSAAAGLAVGLASHSTVAGVATGGLLWVLAGAGLALRAWWRSFRRAPVTEVDPWALPDPWRQLVSDAVASERRFAAAAASLAPGPLRDRVVEMQTAVHTQVLRVWDGARRGAALSGGYPAGAGTAPAAALAAQLRSIQEQRATGGGGGPAVSEGAEEALAARLREARRAEAVAAEILDGLRSALARLDSAVTSLAELASGAPRPGLDSGTDSIDAVVTELSALRSGLDEVAGALPGAGSPAPEDPAGR